MKLKKILAGALALAMSVAFSVSAFAEATPGEADNLADILVTNPSAYEPRNDLYTVLMENKNINVSEKATIAMGSALLANNQSSTYTVNDATVIAYSSYSAKDQLNISRVDVNEDRSVITLEAAYTSRAGWMPVTAPMCRSSCRMSCPARISGRATASPAMWALSRKTAKPGFSSTRPTSAPTC